MCIVGLSIGWYGTSMLVVLADPCLHTPILGNIFLVVSTGLFVRTSNTRLITKFGNHHTSNDRNGTSEFVGFFTTNISISELKTIIKLCNTEEYILIQSMCQHITVPLYDVHPKGYKYARIQVIYSNRHRRPFFFSGLSGVLEFICLTRS